MLTLDNATEIGKYRVIEPIGSGAMATVYKVEHTQLGAVYALKVLDGVGAQMADRLLREGRIQAALRHPNVVTVHDVLEVQGQPALLMDLVDGPSLKHFLLAEHPLEIEVLDTLALGIMKGVRAVHRAGHLHRDLKPSNILLARVEGELVPRIADFGLAKVFNNPNDPIQTRTGQLLGSPAFMSPEQTMSAKTLDERTDIWATGAVLYTLVTGNLAFPHNDIVTIFSMIRSGDFRDPRSLRDDVPDRMWRALFSAMTVDADARVESIDVLMDIWTGKLDPQVHHGPVPSTVDLPMDDAPVPLAPPALPVPPEPDESTEDLLQVTEDEPVAAPLARSAQRADRTGLIAAVATILFAIGALAWFLRPAPPPLVQPAPPLAVLAPSPTPSPVLAPVEPVPTPAPMKPALAVAPVAVPLAPAPVSPVPDVAPLEPEPAPAAAGTFTASGDADKVWLVQGDDYLGTGSVPAGTYTVAARFPGRPLAPIDGLKVTVEPGAVVAVQCRAGFFTCRIVN